MRRVFGIVITFVGCGLAMALAGCGEKEEKMVIEIKPIYIRSDIVVTHQVETQPATREGTGNRE
jgi:hypothetical protein